METKIENVLSYMLHKKKKIPIVKAAYYLLYQFKVETEARKDGKGADTSHGEIGDPWKKMSRPCDM